MSATRFSAFLAAELSHRALRPRSIARRGGLTVGQIHSLLNGRRKATAVTVMRVVEVLGLGEEAARELSLAACRDYGFKV